MTFSFPAPRNLQFRGQIRRVCIPLRSIYLKRPKVQRMKKNVGKWVAQWRFFPKACLSAIDSFIEGFQFPNSGATGKKCGTERQSLIY